MRNRIVFFALVCNDINTWGSHIAQCISRLCFLPSIDVQLPYSNDTGHVYDIQKSGDIDLFILHT